MRLALAAAASGRTDEALRILRAVAESDAQPGPNDPRQQARLLGSAVIARLLAASPNDAVQTEALTRQLKQLQVLQTPGRLYVLTWESLGDALGIVTPAGDVVDAAGLGLYAVSSPELSLSALKALVRVRNERASAERVHFRLHELVFDGSHFQVQVVAGEVG